MTPIPSKLLIVSLISLAFSQTSQADEWQAQAVTAYPGELKYSSQLPQIGVPEAWGLGATGLGVTVSVIDAGVNSKHSELRGAMLSGFNTSGNRLSNDTADVTGHGTHVAGIIAAAANNWVVVGVAPEAKILPIRVADRWGNMSYAAVDRGLRLAADYSPIANASLGGAPGAEAGVRYAVSKGMLLVASAGNSGLSDPLWPARYAKESWAMGRIIAVGAVDANNVIASWSNRAGDTRDFYLVAPGVNIASTYGSGYAYMSGTSMASPHVAGVAALVKSYWPQLKAEQIASILFQTATDLGQPGVDEIYGRGLVNAAKAMQPVGATALTTSSGAKTTSWSTGFSAPAASGAALKRQSMKVVVTDDFGRGFSADLSNTVRTQPAPALAASLQEAGRRSMLVDRVLPDGSRFAAQLTGQVDAHLAAPSPQAKFEARDQAASQLRGFSLVQRAAGGREWAVGGHGFASHFFGSASELAQTRANVSDAANPMFSLVPGHSHLGLAMPLAGSWKLKSGILSTAAAGSFAEQQGQSSVAPRTSMLVAGVSHVSDDGAVGVTVGQLAENNALLGGQGGAGLRLEGSLKSRFVTVDAARSLGGGWAGFATWTVAMTPARTNTADSLIAGNSRLQADAFSLGVAREAAFRKGDRLSLVVSQPLRLRAGSLGLDLPQGQDEAGNLLFGRQSVGLTPAGRELRKELHYTLGLSRGESLSAFLMHRSQPGHDNTQASDVATGLRWSRGF